MSGLPSSRERLRRAMQRLRSVAPSHEPAKLAVRSLVGRRRIAKTHVYGGLPRISAGRASPRRGARAGGRQNGGSFATRTSGATSGGGEGGGGGGDDDGGGGDDDGAGQPTSLPIGLIDPHPRSAAIYGSEARPELVESIKEHGLKQPLVVTQRGDRYLLLGGHQRFAAAVALGLATVPVRVEAVPTELEVLRLVLDNAHRTKTPSQKLQEAQALEPFLRSDALERAFKGKGSDGSGGRGRKKTPCANAHQVSGVKTRDALAARVGLSGRNLDRLKEIAKKAPEALKEIDAGKKSIGGAYAELRRAERQREHKAQAEAVTHVPEVVYGDCRVRMRSVEDGQVAVVLSDPPYALSTEGKETPRAGTVPLDSNFGEWDQLPLEEARGLIDACAGEFFRVLRPGGVIYLFTGDILLPEWIAALREAGFEFPRPHLLVWVKSNPPPSVRKAGWRSAVEPILYVRKPGKGTFNWQADGDMKNALTFPIVHGPGRVHPTEKPVALLERLLLVSTNPGDLVLDPFAGSGATGEAALRNGRRALLIERDATFHGLATERITRLAFEVKGQEGSP